MEGTIFPVIKEIRQPEAIALERFRKLFSLPITRAIFDADGKSMYYKIVNTSLAKEYTRIAQDIIHEHQLPLVAESIVQEGETRVIVQFLPMLQKVAQ